MRRQSNGKNPGAFIESILQWLCAVEHLDSHPVVVSDLELVCLLINDDVFGFLFNWMAPPIGSWKQWPN